jgi:dUTP pyrophosphatase
LRLKAALSPADSAVIEMKEMKGIAKFYKVSFEQYQKDRAAAEPGIKKDDLLKEYENIKLPARATKGSAGYDFFLPRDISIEKGQEILIQTGIRAQIEEGWALMLYPRSGLGFKYGLRLLNTTGIIDSDYFLASNEGHIMSKLSISGEKPLKLKARDRFMQGVFVPFGITKDDAPIKAERTGGFGSTDENTE